MKRGEGESGTVTADEIARLRALCEAATPGPWVASDGAGCRPIRGDKAGTHRQAQRREVAFTAGLSDDQEDAANAAFIAAARTALPALLAAVERLMAEVERLRAEAAAGMEHAAICDEVAARDRPHRRCGDHARCRRPVRAPHPRGVNMSDQSPEDYWEDAREAWDVPEEENEKTMDADEAVRARALCDNTLAMWSPATAIAFSRALDAVERLTRERDEARAAGRREGAEAIEKAILAYRDSDRRLDDPAWNALTAAAEIAAEQKKATRKGPDRHGP